MQEKWDVLNQRSTRKSWVKGRKWHLKCCQGVTEQRVWPLLTPLEQPGQLAGRSQSEAVRHCKNTFTQLTLSASSYRPHSVDEAEFGPFKKAHTHPHTIPSGPEGNNRPLFFISSKLERLTEWKRVTDRWTPLMFSVSARHRWSALLEDWLTSHCNELNDHHLAILQTCQSKWR